MTLSRLSAGAGYRYLLRHTASADVPRATGESLTAYYAASTSPPGRWIGSGLAGLAAGIGLPVGSMVFEEAMIALYGSGADPVTGEALGRAYPQYRSTANRVADAVEALPAAISDDARIAAVARIEASVRNRPARRAVAGFDLTFTAPKSVSVLWALGDPTVQAAVEAAHSDAVAAVLGFVEDRFLGTRTGAGSTVRVGTRGMIAAAFDHYDSRSGDPNLHTHVVVANKVQGPDGQWRSIDASVLYRAAVACSELYDTVVADALAARLSVAWSERSKGPRRSPGFEITGVGDELLALFSTRSDGIGTELTALAEAFTHRHGREPSRIETLRLRQQATLATRPAKTPQTLTELRLEWQSRAATVTGRPTTELLAPVWTRRDEPIPIAEMLATQGNLAINRTAGLDDCAVAVLDGVAARRATWTRANLLAEAARATRGLRCAAPDERFALLDAVVETGLKRCIALDQALEPPTAERSRIADAAPTRFTTPEVLDLESDLSAGLDETGAPTVPVGLATALVAPMPGQRLSADQQAVVVAVATGPHRVQVLLGPAGSGKTRTLALLAHAWRTTHGPHSVVGLAPSATAAVQLATSVRSPADTLAKWLHSPGEGLLPALGSGSLVVVDEAAMASTRDLHAVLIRVQAAGAKLLLVGDHHQLDAIDAGGAFALLADRADSIGRLCELQTLWRFTHPWESQATRALRIGDPAALDVYAEHGRLHDGPADLMHHEAYAGWAADVAAGQDSLLLAADRETVTALNVQARADRVKVGAVIGREIALHDGTRAAAGDWIVTRRNDRRLRYGANQHVRNGTAWTVLQVHDDGGLIVAPRRGQNDGELVRLPADYVDGHVELGYAATVHRAQGATSDTTHLIVTEGTTRQALYVGLTRGRAANHAYAVTDSPSAEIRDRDDELTGRQVLEYALRRDDRQHSATAVIAASQPGSGGATVDAVHTLAAVNDALRRHRTERRPTPRVDLGTPARTQER